MAPVLLALSMLSLAARAGEGDRDDPLLEDEALPVGSVRRAGALGLGLGAGTSAAGLSVKYWISERFALQAVAGAAYDRAQGQPSHSLVETDPGWQAGVGLSVDLLHEGNSIAELDDLELGWSAGGGAGLWATDDLGLAVGGVLGLELGFLTIPLDLVAEYRPRVLILPEPTMDWFSLSGHLRWYL